MTSYETGPINKNDVPEISFAYYKFRKHTFLLCAHTHSVRGPILSAVKADALIRSRAEINWEFQILLKIVFVLCPYKFVNVRFYIMPNLFLSDLIYCLQRRCLCQIIISFMRKSEHRSQIRETPAELKYITDPVKVGFTTGWVIK